MLFSEEGISFDGELREFQKGFAILGIETRVPVVSAIINDTFEALSRGKIIPKISKILVFIDSSLNLLSTLSDNKNLKEKLETE